MSLLVESVCVPRRLCVCQRFQEGRVCSRLLLGALADQAENCKRSHTLKFYLSKLKQGCCYLVNWAKGSGNLLSPAGQHHLLGRHVSSS